MNSRKVWADQEDRTIEALVKKHGQKSWANIANQLFEMYGTQRSGKQCRQRWHNHLNPEIEKKAWSKKEQERLFQLHKLHGNKWTVIAESIPGRTDNSIKNYFYSTIRRSLRRISKFLGSKNSTEKMKDIKPSTLSKIFAADNELSTEEFNSPEEKQLVRYIKNHSETVRLSIVKFTNYKPKRAEKAAEFEKGELEDVINKMVYINSIYQKLKDDEKLKKKESSTNLKDGRNMNSEESLEDESLEEDESEQGSPKEKIFKQTGKEEDVKMEEEYQDMHKLYQSKVNQAEKVEQPTECKSFDFPFIKFPQNKNEPNPALTENEMNNLSLLESQFMVELKQDDEFSLFRKRSGSVSFQSPGYPFHTPSNNPYNFFMSPSTPISTMEGNLNSLVPMQNSTLDEFKNLIQQEIESNLKGENKKTSTTTIGASPGSAFSYCFQ